mgnify:CR=1 FL=1
MWLRFIDAFVIFRAIDLELANLGNFFEMPVSPFLVCKPRVAIW